MTTLLSTLAALALAAGPAVTLTPVARPSAARQGEAVAHVVSGGGKVLLVDDAKYEFPAAQGTPVLATDTVKVASSAFALLLLDKNGLVVRLDDDLELRVSDIALLNAPKQNDSLEKQLNRLLTPEEKGKLPQRMIGWYASPTAADVASVRPERDDESTKPPSKAMAMEEGRGGGSSKQKEMKDALGSMKKKLAFEPKAPPAAQAPASPPPPPPAVQPPAPAQARPGAQSAPPPSGGSNSLPGLPPLRRAESSEKSTQESDDEGGRGRRSKAALPEPKELGDPKLRSCLSATLKALGPLVEARFAGSIGVKFRVKDGKVQLRLDGAVPVDACVQDWFDAHQELATSGADWTKATVPLK